MYSLFRNLSLDVALGAGAVYLFAGKLAGGKPELPVLSTIIMVVWIIYTTDHLLDSSRREITLIRPRYKWHRNNRRILLPVLILVSLLTLFSVLFLLPSGVVKDGLTVGTVVVLYLCVNHIFRNSYFGKEFWISLIYLGGSIFVPVQVNFRNLHLLHILILSGLFFLVQSNVLIYSWYESGMDMREGMQSFSVRFGRILCGRLIYFLLAATGLLCFIILIAGKGEVFVGGLILLGMAVLLMLIRAKPDYFGPSGRYGVAADLAFLAPALILLYRA